MQLKVVPHEESVFTIQKSCLSKWKVFGQEHLEQTIGDGKYALVKMSENTHCVCKLIFQREIHPSFVYLDASVIRFKASHRDSLPEVLLSGNNGSVHDKNIEVLPQVLNIKDLSVSIVFEEICDIRKWKLRTEKISNIAHEILKMYIVTNDCVVFLRNLKESLRHGIHAIVVHSISLCEDGIVPGRVTSSTNLSLTGLVSKLRFEQTQKASLAPQLGGLDSPTNLITQIIRSNVDFKQPENHLGLRPTRQVLLTGPPGCGKTSLVHKVSADCGATLVTVSGPEVVSSKPGATEEALRRIFEEASILAEEHEHGVCILLLDDVDTLCTRRDLSSTSSHAVRSAVQLMSLLEQADNVPGLIIIATTNKPNLLDPSVRRPGRLETEVYIGVPSEPERESILRVLLEPLSPPDIDGLSRHVASLTPGYVGADLALICQEVALMLHRRENAEHTVSEVEHSDNMWISDFQTSVRKTAPSALRSGLGVVMTTPTSMDSIGGLESVKQELRVAVEWPLTHPEAFIRLGLPQPKGALLYGPPGCAKTSIARALATSTNTTFLSVSAADLYSPYVGEAERRISELFHRARTGAPAILFIDEIDALVGCRGDRERGVQERVLSALLTEMDGVGIRLEAPTADVGMDEAVGTSKDTHAEKWKNTGVMIIAATNRPDMLDDALLRPGRFDKLLYVPPPSRADRLDILHCVTANMPLSDCVDLSDIAQRTGLFTGADLAHLCKEAALHALTEDGMSTKHVKRSHFEAVLPKVRPSLTDAQVEWYVRFKDGRL